MKIERKNVFARFLKSRKVTFEVYHQRSFLMRDIKLGQAELKLHDLLNQSTVHEFVEVCSSYILMLAEVTNVLTDRGGQEECYWQA